MNEEHVLDLDASVDGTKFNGNLIRQRRKTKNLSQDELVDLCKGSGVYVEIVRELERMTDRRVRSTSRARNSHLKSVADMLELTLRELHLKTPWPGSIHTAETLSGLGADFVGLMSPLTKQALWSIRTALRRPHLYPHPQTDPEKVGGLRDKTLNIDQVSGDVILGGLKVASRDSNSFVRNGAWLLREEHKPVFLGEQNASRTNLPNVITIDEADDSSSFKTGLGGTVLMSLYCPDVGYAAAVIGDFCRERLAIRIHDGNSQFHQLESLEPGSDGSWKHLGTPLVSKPGRQTVLDGASINFFMGKGEIVVGVAESCYGILNSNLGSVHSFGGSMGPLLVADGSVHASIEVVKGFKKIDLIPGLFIAKGAGCTILELNENYDAEEFDFGPDEDIEQILGSDNMSQEIESIRQRFVVACTPELAEQIVRKLKVRGKIELDQ